MSFATPTDHLSAELQRLSLLLQREILRLRAMYQLSLDEFRGLYVSDEQVDRFVDQAPLTEQSPDLRTLKDRADAMRIDNDAQLIHDFPWAKVVADWKLNRFEQDVLLLALAPEIDLKYETIFAYLNNDVTRKWPTFDLALRLFAQGGSTDPSLRRYLLPDSTLFRQGLLLPVRLSADRPSWLAGGFSVAPQAAQFILGFTPHDATVFPFIQEHAATTWEGVPVSDSLRAQMQSLTLRPTSDQGPPLLVMTGRAGSGRRAAAQATCGDAGIPMLSVDLQILRAEMARNPNDPSSRLIDILALRARLTRAALYLNQADTLFEKDGSITPDARRLLSLIVHTGAPLFLACDPDAAWRDLVAGHSHLVIDFPEPDYPTRRALWATYLHDHAAHASDPAIDAVASRFILTPGQIHSAVAALPSAPTDSALIEAARSQSDHNLGSLATRIRSTCGWDDLVLPPVTLRTIHDIVAAVRNRHVVYDDWGFANRVAAGQGLKVLFAGPSGTGKTMTAGVIAADLGLDLYRIDLAGIVSKYIGETEKNLERIFRAARHSNAVIFIDEADALLHKRFIAEDAQDQFANVQTSYLLQRIEEHRGVVILATNLSKNIDDAFNRRMHFTLNFPLPDEQHREKLWRGMFPPAVPLSPDVDFVFLAKQFPLAGGDIRNVALDAAFLAAADGRVINMRLLTQATARQMIKQGTLPSPSSFKQFYPLIGYGPT